jgi:hypothetical protein
LGKLPDPVLARVQVQKKIDQRPLQPRARSPQQREPRAGDLGRPLEIQDAQGLADGHVVARLEVELPRLAPSLLLDVAGLVRRRRHARVRDIGNVEHLVGEPRFHVPDLLVQRRDPVRQFLHLGLPGLGLSLFLVAHELADLARAGIEPVLELVGLEPPGLALGHQGADGAEVKGIAPVPERLLHPGHALVVKEQFQVQHLIMRL